MNEWIPVKNFPLDPIPVLLCRDEGEEGGCYFLGYFNGQNFISYDPSMTDEATHWMPLPEPPNKKKND